ncbi:unnamed protein product [Spirodela intermedia]|uniref:Uncharacterized protein n=1 Tax=Spirodela intermedia TaxID=51605 RepID=A0A7I8J3A2_SPIIN|nr:unnamed protein product [Spirodela intermedia]CAA6663871.1 unnamed protein product [Spirodela intermedia]
MKWFPPCAAAFFSGLLRRCAPLSAIGPGKQVHAHILTRGLLPHVTLQTDLVLMYCRTSDLLSARQTFDEMPTGAPTPGTSSSRHMLRALAPARLFASSPSSNCRSPCRPLHFPGSPQGVRRRRRPSPRLVLHGRVLETGYEEDALVRCSLLDMYAKCGRIANAHQLFLQMRDRDTVAWNSMISGLARAKLLSEALCCLKKMQWKEVEEDPMAVPSVLAACGQAGELRKGKELHGKLIKSSLLTTDSDAAVGNALLEMYSRCGCLADARKVFAIMSNRNVVTWTTLISSCGAHGEGEESLILFEEMVASGSSPTCSHSGLVAHGRRFFQSMSGVHGVEPTAEHYACMVDLLARAGHLQEALELVESMPVEPTGSVWGALLGACAAQGDAAVAELAARRLFDIEPRNAANYAALRGVYAAVGARDGVRRMTARMRALRLLKGPGRSWIPVEGERPWERKC